MKHWWRLLLAAWLAVAAAGASAHEMSMAEMEIRQATPTEFLWRWTASSRAGEATARIQWPEGCRESDGVVRCGEAGLSGRFGIDGVGERFSAALVRVFWLDGQRSVYTITSGQTSVQLFGSADDRRGVGEIAKAYMLLGIEHILEGFDHLLFVIGLLFLVGFQRRLVLVITAFTVAHSITLALSALGWLALPTPPVEATIALSIMLVAGEALHRRPTLSRRWPALVALLFGLVHGLGFAGALREIGLPENHLAVALLTFNLGVEFGQLLVVAAAFALWRVLAGWPRFHLAARPALYAIGGMAAFWTIDRVAGMLA